MPTDEIVCLSPTKVLLDRLVHIAPPVIDRIAKPEIPHCVLSSAIGYDVLARLGIAAEPFPVELTIHNEAWAAWVADGAPGGHEEQMRRGAYLLTNMPNWRGKSFTRVKLDKPWDGHLVLRVPDGDAAWLVDLNIGAFTRPLRSVYLPDAMVAPLFGDRVEGTYTDRGVVTTVGYKPLVAEYAMGFETARDWAARDRFADTVNTLARKLGKG
jgi:hypothetical protein